MTEKVVERSAFRRISAAFLLAAFLVLSLSASQALAQSLERRDIVIETAGKERHQFKVELAATPAERAKGLMFRRDLPPATGMLFDFGVTDMVVMWMKNTLLPLDMLFIDEAGRVVNIAERTVPGSLAPISSEAPVKYVLEIGGGTSQRLRLKAGDRIVKGLMP